MNEIGKLYVVTVNITNEKYYFVDGYDNFRNLRVEDINNIIDEIKYNNTFRI